eukprot:523324_1
MKYNLPFRKWKEHSVVVDEKEVAQDELYQETSDVPSIALVNQLSGSQKSLKKIESSNARKIHIQTYLKHEERAQSQIYQRINLLNTVLIYKSIKEVSEDNFKLLIEGETNPQILILKNDIQFYDSLLYKTDRVQLEQKKKWIYEDDNLEVIETYNKTNEDGTDLDELEYSDDEDVDLDIDNDNIDTDSSEETDDAIENINKIWGESFKIGKIDGKSSKFCNVCGEGDLIYSKMIRCKCCKGEGHLYQSDCWDEDEKKLLWKNAKKEDYKYKCRKCKECKKDCNEYKNDEIFKTKELTRNEFISECHRDWTEIIKTMEISAQMWLYHDKNVLIMKMKQCLDINVILCIIEKIKYFKSKNDQFLEMKWNNVLKLWGKRALKFVCKKICESYPGKNIKTKAVLNAYDLFKTKIKKLEMDDNGILDETYQEFKLFWKRQTNYKSYWTKDKEIERLFYSLPNMYKGCEPFLRVYDIGANTDCIEAKMERIGKPIKWILKTRPNIDLDQLAKEILLRDNLPDLGQADKFIERIARRFLLLHKNKSPLIPNRKFIVSSIVDRYLFGRQKQKKKDDEFNEKIAELFASI